MNQSNAVKTVKNSPELLKVARELALIVVDPKASLDELFSALDTLAEMVRPCESVDLDSEEWLMVEELKKENDKLREALKPFADYANKLSGIRPTLNDGRYIADEFIKIGTYVIAPSLGDCRKAKEVLGA